MNYKELVLSKTPSIYVPYDDDTRLSLGTDIINNTYEIQDTAQRNHILNTGTGAYGAKSKQVGHNGAGAYDYRSYVGTGINHSNDIYYLHWECWLKVSATTTSTTNLTVMSLYAGNGLWSSFGGPSVVHQANRKITFRTNNEANNNDHTLTSVGTVPINTWTHIAVQYDYGVKRIYINGVLDNEVNLGTTNVGTFPVYSDINSARVTTWFDEMAVWEGQTLTKPANFPTAADILQRATFPSTKTKWWNASALVWEKSYDERYWNGTQWISMQDLPYKYWNGSTWVTL